MGTDIAIYAEKQVDGAWVPVPEPKDRGKRKRVDPVEAFDIGRPYGLFTVLSGSRVGLGARLAEFPKTFGKRGWPDDMNPVYKRSFRTMYEPGRGGDFGASWLLLDELREFDWQQKVYDFGFVKNEYAWLFEKEEPFPEDFPENEQIFHDLFLPVPDQTTKVYWSQSLEEYVGCVDWFIKSVQKLAPDETLRIIYWFNA